MEKKLSGGVLVLTLCILASCQEGLSISSSIDGSSSSNVSTSSVISSSVDGSSSSNVSTSSVISSSSSDSSSSNDRGNYYPISESSEIDIFSKDLTFNLDMNKISEEAAQELVANDISKYPAEKSSNKRTSYSIKREELHVKDNRTSATYSVKDRFEEKFTVNKTDADNNWSYRRSEEYTETSYFVEDTLIWHRVTEWLSFVKDNYLYEVYAEKAYYEGMENRGTYEVYYTKTDDFNIDEYGGWFGVNLDGYTYFNSTSGFNKIDKSVYTNFSLSSSYYKADDYRTIERDTNYDYYSSGEKGSFGCIANDKGDYQFSDLKYYPSMEADDLRAISYSQDYLLNITNYFTYEENSLTKSTSKNGKGKVIRDEIKENRKKTIDGCEIFYPDLSKFEEREITPPIIK